MNEDAILQELGSTFALHHECKRMGTGKQIETRGHVVGFREEIARAALNDDEFFGWFDNSRDKEAAFVRGAWDFSFHIAAPLARYLSTPEDKTVLEIGYGGGRILAAAAAHFREAIGIDVHENEAVVLRALQSRGIRNARLITSDGRHVPLDDGSVDVVYSFIVLQHVERIEVFSNYIRETARILKPGGVAMLYFGRRCKYSHQYASLFRYWLDRIAELTAAPYEEIPSVVNATNLRVSIRYASRLAEQSGFRVCDRVVSRKRVPDGTRLYGGQHGLVLMKMEQAGR